MRQFAILAFPLALATIPHLSAQDSIAARVTFVDVGQGDAIAVRSPEGKTALIDAGPGPIVPQLRALGIDSIDIAIASHPHADHIGGMAEVIRSMPVRHYMDNGLPHTTATYRSLMGTLRYSDVTYIEATARTISLGSVTLRILPPPHIHARSQEDAGGHGRPMYQNNESAGVVVEYGSFTALLTGDSEVEELSHFLSLGVPQVTVLKAAHHGARNGVTPAWASATRPKVVVISVGAGKPHGHPDPWALRYYDAVAHEIYRTDVHGTVTVLGYRDGTYEVRTGREIAETSPARVADQDDTTHRAPRPAHLTPRTAHRAPRTAHQPAHTAPLSLAVVADAPGNDHYNLNGEYVVIRNATDAEVAIARWTLCDAAGHCHTFPPHARVAPRDSVILFTGSGTSGGRTFFMGRGRAVWNNTGDVATLWDDQGRVVVRHAY